MSDPITWVEEVIECLSSTLGVDFKRERLRQTPEKVGEPANLKSIGPRTWCLFKRAVGGCLFSIPCRSASLSEPVSAALSNCCQCNRTGEGAAEVLPCKSAVCWLLREICEILVKPSLKKA